jgi:glycosyltransferase involved in cell wall biosynthesis
MLFMIFLNRLPEMQEQPLISIVSVTYNQKAFIADCIESVLMQQTDFAWEMVIGDDGSTDGTSEICEQYAAAHPGKIRYYKRSRENRPVFAAGIYPNRYNLIETMKAATGKYIAWLDGDDYYTDPQQLQKVNNFLTDHPQCKIVFTDAHDVDAEGNFLFDSTSKVRRNLKGNDLIYHGPITSTLVMETAAIHSLLENKISSEVPALDQFFMAVLTCGSFMGYVQTAPVGYRYHEHNIMKQVNRRRYFRSTLGNAIALYKTVEKECLPVIRKRIIIACRTNLKYNLLHFNTVDLYYSIRKIIEYIQISKDWKFFLDFWNRKMLFAGRG